MLDVGQVERIIAMDDVVHRNLCITQAYHQLSERLRVDVSDGQANWCTFAKWASKSVGAAIRGESVPRWMLGLLEESPSWEIEGLRCTPPPPWLRHWHGVVRGVERGRAITGLDALLGAVSARLAAGNLKVFAELGPVFTRLCDGFDAGNDPESVIGSIAPLEEGEDLTWLIQAMRHYVAARETERQDRPHHVFTGNVLIGLHEQTRLQSAISGALDAPFDPDAHVLYAHPRFLEHEHLRAVHGEGLRRFWEHEVTMRSVLLATPEGPLHPGVDLQPPPEGTLYSAPLDVLRLRDTQALMMRWDRSRGTGRGTAAANWSVLEDRMNFILNLFRSRHTSAVWHTAPFDADAVAALERGELPIGRL